MVTLTRSIAAFSLIDVIVAMIIVMLSFVITVHLFVTLQNSATGETKVSALLKMDEIIHSVDANDERILEYSVGAYTILREISPYQPHPALQHIRLVATKPNGDTLAYHQYLIFDDEE